MAMVSAIACWSSSQIKELCDFYNKGLTWREYRTENSVFCLWEFVFVALTLSGTKGSLWV